MQEYNLKYESRSVDLDNYDLPDKLVNRPLTDEYIIGESKVNRKARVFKISRVIHTKIDGISCLLLNIQ